MSTAEEGFDTARLRWIVRSTIGNGTLDDENNPDPARGQCIHSPSKIYLQSGSKENWWLIGGRGGAGARVWALDFYTNEGPSKVYEKTTAQSSYEWIIREELGDGLVANV